MPASCCLAVAAAAASPDSARLRSATMRASSRSISLPMAAARPAFITAASYLRHGGVNEQARK